MRMVPAAMLAAVLAGAPSGIAAQTPSNPLHVLCKGWSNPWAYPGSSDCMWAWADDRDFARKAAAQGTAELQLATIAERKASSGAIRQFAQKLAEDSARMQDGLRQAAARSSIAVPGALDAKHRAEIDSLSSLSGPAFDRAFIHHLIREERHSVGEFSDEAEAGSDAQLKAFAAETIPAPKQQIHALKELRAQR